MLLIYSLKLVTEANYLDDTTIWPMNKKLDKLKKGHRGESLQVLVTYLTSKKS